MGCVPGSNGVVSVLRAFELLRAVPEGDGTLSALARRTGLPMATVARLMGTLEQAGAVLRSEKVYRIGPTLMELAGDEPAAQDLLAVAQPHLHHLASATDETAGVVQAMGSEYLHLGQVATAHDVAVRDWTGVQLPLHAGCIGFVVMAHRSAEAVAGYMAGELEAFSPLTVTDPKVVAERLAQVRQVGWLWTTGEYAPDITTVAAPVLDRERRAVGAIHVHGPAYRFPGPADPDAIGRDVADAARAVSMVIGWRADEPGGRPGGGAGPASGGVPEVGHG